jgi:hypothetical protein
MATEELAYLFFFIGNQFCPFKTRLSVFKSNFKKTLFSMATSRVFHGNITKPERTGET